MRQRRRAWLAVAVTSWAALAVVAFLWVSFNEQTDNIVTSFLCWLGGVAFWAVAYGLWERRRREATHEKIDELEAHIERLKAATARGGGTPYADGAVQASEEHAPGHRPGEAGSSPAHRSQSSTPAMTSTTDAPSVSS